MQRHLEMPEDGRRESPQDTQNSALAAEYACVSAEAENHLGTCCEDLASGGGCQADH